MDPANAGRFAPVLDELDCNRNSKNAFGLHADRSAEAGDLSGSGLAGLAAATR
jgi:hypothetical protein